MGQPASKVVPLVQHADSLLRADALERESPICTRK